MKPANYLNQQQVGENAVRLYLDDVSQHLFVVGASCKTDALAGSTSECKEVTLYLDDEQQAAVVGLRFRWSEKFVGKITAHERAGLFVRVERDKKQVKAMLSEPFVHERYPASVVSAEYMAITVGEEVFRSPVNHAPNSRSVDHTSLCKLLSGDITEEGFHDVVEGESLTDRLERLEKDVATYGEMFEAFHALAEEHVRKLDIVSWAAGEELPTVLRYIVEQYKMLFEDRDSLLDYMRRCLVDLEWPEGEAPMKPELWEQLAVLDFVVYMKMQRDKLAQLQHDKSVLAMDLQAQSALTRTHKVALESLRQWYGKALGRHVPYRPSTVARKLGLMISHMAEGGMKPPAL